MGRYREESIRSPSNFITILLITFSNTLKFEKTYINKKYKIIIKKNLRILLFLLFYKLQK